MFKNIILPPICFLVLLSFVYSMSYVFQLNLDHSFRLEAIKHNAGKYVIIDNEAVFKWNDELMSLERSDSQ